MIKLNSRSYITPLQRDKGGLLVLGSRTVDLTKQINNDTIMQLDLKKLQFTTALIFKRKR